MKSEWPSDKVERRAGKRERACVGCGRVDWVRSDNKAARCVPCAGRANGAKGLKSIKARAAASERPCESCGAMHRNAKFCSTSCKTASAAREKRRCNHCGAEFSVLASVLRSNASGNFCTRACYEQWLCRTDRTTGRGSQWRKIRRDAVSRAPFCAMCGTRKNLQVHHVIPFRLTHDNSSDNLVPLCVKHHRMIETLLVSTEEFGFDDVARAAWIGMLKERQMATAAKLKEVASAAI